MSSIRLTKSQYQKLRVKGMAANIIRSAIQRYESGEIVIQNKDKTKEPLIVLPIREKFKYSASIIRQILDAHFSNPINHSAEISRLDSEINAMIAIAPRILIEHSPSPQISKEEIRRSKERIKQHRLNHKLLKE